MDEPSDHLLRTFGAVPTSSRVLDLGCGHGVRTEPLVRLGFDVFACDASPEAVEHLRSHLADLMDEEEAGRRCAVSRLNALGYPDDFFDWVVAFDCLSRLASRDDMLDVLEEVRRVLLPGGWLYVAVPALPEQLVEEHGRGYAGDSGLTPTFTPRTLDELMREAAYVPSEPASVAEHGGQRLVQAIYRKVDDRSSA